MNTTAPFLPSTGRAFLTIPEAAEIVRESQKTIRKRIKGNEIAYSRRGGKAGKVLIRPVDLETYARRWHHPARR